MKNSLIARLFSPVADKTLNLMVYFTVGFSFIAALALSGKLGVTTDGLLTQLLVAGAGGLICLSFCKTLFHDTIPKLHVRYGSYVMAIGYTLIVINQGMSAVQDIAGS